MEKWASSGSGSDRADLSGRRGEHAEGVVSIFPPYVMVAACKGRPIQFLHPQERALIRQAAPQRARDFAAGRFCAHRVLAALGIMGRPLLIGASRSPAWPEGIVGSIAHTRGISIAAACRTCDAAGLGVDVEGAYAVTGSLLPFLCTERERSWIEAFPGGKGPALLFSAKESFFKGYHPLTGFFLEFDDVEVTFERESLRFEVLLANDRAPAVLGARIFHGRYWSDGRFVYTGICFKGRRTTRRT